MKLEELKDEWTGKLEESNISMNDAEKAGNLDELGKCVRLRMKAKMILSELSRIK